MAQATEQCITTMDPTGTIRRIPAVPDFGTRQMNFPRPTMKSILSEKTGIQTGGSAISRVPAHGKSFKRAIPPVPQTMILPMIPGIVETQTGIQTGDAA